MARLTTIGVVLVVMGALAAFVQARSFDLWWHLETGEQILAARSIPRTDDFSFTSSGKPWVDHEWLFQIGLYALWALLGPGGLTTAKAVCAIIAALVGVVAMIRTGATGPVALAVVCWCLVGMRFRLSERPEIATLALAPLAAFLILEVLGTAGRGTATILLLGVVTALWVNLHAGALLVPVLVLAAAAGHGATRWLGPRSGDSTAVHRGGGRLALAAIVSLGALALNPYGPQVYTVPFAIARALSPSNLSNPEWSAPSLQGFPWLFGAILIGAAAAGLSILRRRPCAGARAGLLLATSVMAVASVRHIGVFFAILPVTVDAGSWKWSERASSRGLALTSVVLAAGWMWLAPPDGAALGSGVQWERFPVDAASFVDDRLPEARLYNDVRFGGYLIWRGYPQRRVFIDGRNEVHAELLEEISRSLDDGRAWERLLVDYGVQGAVVQYRESVVRVRDGSISTFSETHFPRSRYALVHWDDMAMVFVRREGIGAALAASSEWERVRPEAWRLGLVETEQPEQDPALADEIRRKLRQDPQCVLAKEMASVYGISLNN